MNKTQGRHSRGNRLPCYPFVVQKVIIINSETNPSCSPLVNVLCIQNQTKQKPSFLKVPLYETPGLVFLVPDIKLSYSYLQILHIMKWNHPFLWMLHVSLYLLKNLKASIYYKIKRKLLEEGASSRRKEHRRPFISLKYSTCFLLFSQQDFSVPAARSSKFHQHGLSLCLFRHRCLWPSSCSKCSPSYLTLFHISPGHPNRHYFLPHCI